MCILWKLDREAISCKWTHAGEPWKAAMVYQKHFYDHIKTKKHNNNFENTWGHALIKWFIKTLFFVALLWFCADVCGRWLVYMKIQTSCNGFYGDVWIRVIGLLTTNVYVFFYQVAWPCLIWQGKRCFKFRTTNCSAQLRCFMLFVFVNVISCSWEFNPKYPDVNKQYLDSKALPTVPAGESLCLWSRTARELPASRLVTARTARWWGFKCDRCAGRVDGCGVGIGARLFGMHVI